MNRDDPPTPSRWLGVYTVAVPLAAAVVVTARTYHEPIAVTQLLLFLAGLAVLAELLPVRLPGGGRVSVGSAINFAAIIAFGVTEAMLVGAFALAVANLVQRRANRALFNAGQIALTVFVSGSAWSLLGGTSPNTGLAADVLPGLATVGLYLVANSGLVIGWLSLQSG
ncbi:MAG TPA: hypothetical protein VFK80_09755, partial [Limnochordia bacterium]|nr:hypothetical protein [Limnochordia bacterium]